MYNQNQQKLHKHKKIYLKMKRINQYIIERLKLSKNGKDKVYNELKSVIESNTVND